MAKINISVSSDSSKPRITISKGPVGPQGEQGVQGEVGPQGPAGTVLELSAIPDVILNNEPPVLPGSYSQFGDLIQNILTWDPNYNGVGRWTYLGDVTLTPPVVSAPPPGQAFVYRAIGENLTAVSSLSSNIMGVGVSGSMPNDVKLYVDGDSRFNGSVEIASGGATVYTLPTADGTANQVMKTDGSGNVTFGGLPLLASNGITQSVINGINFLSVSDSLGVSSLSTTNDVTIGGDIYFAGSETKLIRPFDAGITAGPLTIQSNGDLVIELDQNADEVDKAFIVKNGADAEVFNVNESGEVRVNNAYTLPTTDSNANYFLKTDGSGQLFFATVNGTSGNVGASPPPPPTYSLDDLTDVDITTVAPTSGQALVWDGTQWEPGDSFSQSDFDTAFSNKSIDALSDVDTTTAAPAAGQALVWSGSQWEPGAGSPWTTSGSDIYYTAGNVGIGIAAPTEALDVVGKANITDASNNVLISTRNSAITATNTVAVGYQALTALTTGAGNTALGYQAGSTITSGTNNTLIGNGADVNNDSNSGCTIIGAAAITHANASSQTGVGHAVGTGVQGTSIGVQAGSSSSVNQVAVGYRAGNLASGTDGTQIGKQAGRYTTGGYNTLIGSEAGQGASGTSTFANTVAVGYQALTALTTGAGNTAVGYQAGTVLTDASNNTMLGYKAGNSVTQNNNTLIGYQAGKDLGSTNNLNSGNTFIGSNAGHLAAYQTNNTYIGYNAAAGNAGNNSYSSVVIGFNAAPYTTSGQTHTQAVIVGAEAAQTSGNQSNVTLVGWGTNRFGGARTVAVGHSAAYNAAGGYNVAVGFQALTGSYNQGTSSNTQNVAVGYRAGAAITTGGGNIFLGYEAGANETGSNKLYIENSNSTTPLIYGEFDNDLVRINGDFEVTGNVGIGTATPTEKLHVDGNTKINGILDLRNSLDPDGGVIQVTDTSAVNVSVAIGNMTSVGVRHIGIGDINDTTRWDYVGIGPTSVGGGAASVVIGNSAASNNTSSFITAIGSGTNRFSSGDYSTAVGTSALYNDGVLGSAYTTAIGHNAGNSQSGTFNSWLGVRAGFLANGNYSLAAGSYAGYYIGENSVALGAYAAQGDATSTFTNTVAVGYQALTALTTGVGNTAVGYQAGDAITSGNNNTAVGYQALTTSTTGYSNTAVGEQAGAALTTGGDNVFIGRGAGKSVTNKYQNVFIGKDAGNNGSAQVGIGIMALAANNGDFNIGIGVNANRFGSGISSVAVGWSAGYQGNNSYAASIGHFAGQNGGINGFYAGYQAGQYATGTDNVIIGHQSAQNAGSGGYNTIVGSGAAVGVSGTSTFANTVAVGYQALTALTTGVGNTAVGYQAGDGITTSGYNTVVGYSADVGTSNSSTVMGYQASGSGSGVVAIGYQAQGGGITNGYQNTGLGYQSNYQGASEKNVSIGAFSGYNGNIRSVSVGHGAGYSGADYGVFIGYQAGYNETGSNKLYIENSNSATPLIYGEFDTDLVRINGDFEVTGNINNSIDALNDVDTTTVAPADGQALVWDNANSKWEPGSISVEPYELDALVTDQNEIIRGQVTVASNKIVDIMGDALADTSNANCKKFLGFHTSSGNCVLKGVVDAGNSISGATAGSPLWIGASGSFSANSPTTTGHYSRVVGYYINTLQGGEVMCYFDPSKDWIQID